MTGKALLVIGAAGDVGRGVIAAALSAGWEVVAAGRDGERLAGCFAADGKPSPHLLTGDLSTEAGAAALWEGAIAAAGRIDAVVVAVNAPNRTAALAEWNADQLAELLAANLLTHFNATKIMLPRLGTDGVFIGIGGGTADFVIPGNAAVSIAQAGLRMMYRGFARECVGNAAPRELMIVSMVNGASKRDRAQPEWLTDAEIGRHVCAILDAPDRFPGPILKLASRAQVGSPEPTTQKDR